MTHSVGGPPCFASFRRMSTSRPPAMTLPLIRFVPLDPTGGGAGGQPACPARDGGGGAGAHAPHGRSVLRQRSRGVVGDGHRVRRVTPWLRVKDRLGTLGELTVRRVELHLVS